LLVKPEFLLGALFGYCQITTLVFIAYDRYNVIVKGIGAKPLTFGRVKSCITFIWLWALFWSVGPLVGFGGYAMEGIISS
jgi:r-opsin